MTSMSISRSTAVKIKPVYKSLHYFGNTLPSHYLHHLVTVIEFGLQGVLGAEVLDARDEFRVPIKQNMAFNARWLTACEELRNMALEENSACRSMETQVDPSSDLKMTKHHQSDPSNILGILGSS